MITGVSNAEALSLQVVEWLIGHDELLTVFMGSTGSTVDDMRNGIQDTLFLGSVLDFLLMDDRWIKEFCDAYGHEPTAPYQARQLLPGGELPHYT